MNEQELREMIRASIARHLGADTGPVLSEGAVGHSRRVEGPADPQVMGRHASHQRLPLVSGDEEGACVIEPSVRCTHCGYCLSLGH